VDSLRTANYSPGLKYAEASIIYFILMWGLCSKHLLLATAQQSAPQPSASSGGLHAFGEVVYFSVAPDVFQSSNKRKFVAAPHQQPTIPRS
jgi:hypothetical protein